MKKAFYIIPAILIGVFLVSGCEGLQSGDVGSRYFTIVPGDCTGIAYRYDVSAKSKTIVFGLSTTVADPVRIRYNKTGTCHQFPSEAEFDKYDHSVKDSFYQLSFDMERGLSWCPKYAFYSTVFPIGPATVTADRDFQGIKAHEDLSSLMLEGPEYSTEPLDHPLNINRIEEFIHDLEEYHNLGSFQVAISAPDTMEKDTKFTISVPARKVKILQWFNDLATSPDAPMPYSDEIITWNVVVQAFKNK